MSKKLWSLLGVAAALIGALFLFKYSSWGAEIVWNASSGGVWLFPLVAVSALLDSVNPCAFSVLLITIAFLFSLGKPRREVLRLGASYIAGLFLAYLLIGLGILQALHIFGVPHFMGRLGAVVIIIFGILQLLSHFFPQVNWLPGIPASVHQKMATLLERVSLPGVFLVGVLVALCEFPCTGGPYLMILGLLHDSQTYLSGFGYLLFYNLLFVSPLAVILLVASHQELLSKVDAWRKDETKKLKVWLGLAMVALGLIILLLM
jgi:cytochrome c biogenesis protein CcdA